MESPVYFYYMRVYKNVKNVFTPVVYRLKTTVFLFFAIFCLFCFRHTFDHINNNGIELCGILWCNDWSPGIFFDIFPCVAGNLTTTPGVFFCLQKAG